MKFISYNIRDGAVDTFNQIIEIVQKESPDYLSLNEANTFAADDQKLLKQFAERTGFPYFSIALSGEDDYHVASFSKHPFKKVYEVHPLDRACIVGEIDSTYGPISIASFHLTPYSEDQRLPEIQRILEAQNGYEHKILMGDMNSLSRRDGYRDEMIEHFNEMQVKKFTTNGALRFDVLQTIENAGYVDSAVELDKNMIFTVPTPANIDTTHAQMRLDYIFVSTSLAPHLTSYSVIKDELTHIASDHYPVKIELH
ncbi:hypothetical protein HGA88_02645 [Candidatus Roizmanbacteria bacterium]|nr:hypothetical protein [Candidatus Roizmanbacteria bacterium]